MKEFLKYIFAFFIISAFMYGSTILFNNQKAKQKNNFRVVVSETNNGWLYKIYEKNKLLIKQETIPSFPENIYFQNKNDAEKIGYLVLEKIRKGQFPPAVTRQEIILNNITLRKKSDL